MGRKAVALCLILNCGVKGSSDQVVLLRVKIVL